MKLRLYNARILTMEKDRPIFKGEVWIKQDKIVLVASDEELKSEWIEGMPRIHWDIELDCEGNLLMPGFKNCHTHSAMTCMRSLADDLPLQEWLNEKVFPFEKKLTAEDVYLFTKLAILEYLTSGITAISDMYFIPEATARACFDMGMRCVLVSGLNNHVSSIAQVEAEYQRWNKKGSLVSYMLGCHAEYTTNSGLLNQLSGLAHRYRAPVYLHMSETMEEVRDCKKRNGMSPAFYLDTMGMFDYGGGAYHCVHMTEDDLEVFKRNRMVVITNPSSNAKLASGVAPVKDFINNRIPVALGTDGAASNNCLDMFREMFMVSGLSKLREMDAASISAMDVLRMATVEGSKALHLNKTDVLAKGKMADLIMLDLHQPNMQPLNNITSNIVYSGSKSNVKMTIINGKILYKDGKFNVGENVEKIYEACNQAMERLLDQ